MKLPRVWPAAPLVPPLTARLAEFIVSDAVLLSRLLPGGAGGIEIEREVRVAAGEGVDAAVQHCAAAVGGGAGECRLVLPLLVRL